MADNPTPYTFEGPPTALAQRKAKIQLGITNTLRFPGDLEKDDPGPWFGGSAPLQHTPTDKNDVELLVDGATGIGAMFDAIDATSSSRDYVLMLNWFVDPFLTVDGKPDSLGALLAKKLQAGVAVRGMYWRKYAPWPFRTSQNADMVELLNRGRVERDDNVISYLPKGTPKHSRRNGAAIFDGRLNRISIGIEPVALDISVGSHHQKLLCVKANGALTTFCGGMDFNPDRLVHTKDAKDGSPLHDVHTRVVGPACNDMVKTVMDRWTDHPDSAQLDTETGLSLAAIVGGDADPSAQKGTGRHKVQMGRTFGTGTLIHGSGQTGHYAFAPAGEKTAKALVSNAITSAKKFIYLEDQYFVNVDAAKLLAQALSNGIKHLTIVMPHHKISDLPLTLRYRYESVKILRQADPTGKRLRVFYKCLPGENPGEFHTYVHSKITIVDDEFAVVGTVNYNRRSWNYDSEMNIGIYDPSVDRVLTNRFAHWLRMRIWAEHLFGATVADARAFPPPSAQDDGINTQDCEYAEMFDGVAAGAQWLELMELQKSWLAKNPGTTAKDYDQSQYNSAASVRPYDLTAYNPDEEVVRVGSQIPIFGIIPDLWAQGETYAWDHFLDPWQTGG